MFKNAFSVKGVSLFPVRGAPWDMLREPDGE